MHEACGGLIVKFYQTAGLVHSFKSTELVELVAHS